MESKFIIRQIAEADYPTVYNVIKTAFETADHRDGDEQDYAVGLRNGADYIPELDLVAELDGQIIGHIMFTRTDVTCPDGSKHDTLLAAPLSVLIGFRKLGAGSALMKEGFRRAVQMGHTSVFLIGDPAYYRRFGYELAKLHGICHESLPEEYIQVRELVRGSIEGVTGMIRM